MKGEFRIYINSIAGEFVYSKKASGNKSYWHVKWMKVSFLGRNGTSKISWIFLLQSEFFGAVPHFIVSIVVEKEEEEEASKICR